jgi:hypothetical protein
MALPWSSNMYAVVANPSKLTNLSNRAVVLGYSLSIDLVPPSPETDGPRYHDSKLGTFVNTVASQASFRVLHMARCVFSLAVYTEKGVEVFPALMQLSNPANDRFACIIHVCVNEIINRQRQRVDLENLADIIRTRAIADIPKKLVTTCNVYIHRSKLVNPILKNASIPDKILCTHKFLQLLAMSTYSSIILDAKTHTNLLKLAMDRNVQAWLFTSPTPKHDSISDFFTASMEQAFESKTDFFRFYNSPSDVVSSRVDNAIPVSVIFGNLETIKRGL